MDLLEAMARRVSTREFSLAPVPRERLEELVSTWDRSERLAEVPLRVHLVYEGERIERQVKGILGDYGKVIRAPHYVVLTALERPGWLVEAGYRFEQLLLQATIRGLGTCWVGGFFRENELGSALEVRDERVVALSPLGEPSATKSVLARAMRAVIGSADRKPVESLFSWEAHGAPLPESIRGDPRWQRLLEAVRRAPSWANKQPWRFVVRPGEVLLYKQARQVKEGKDYHLVDCGIALSHLCLAARELGMPGRPALESFEVPGAPGAEAVARFRFDEAA